MVLVKDGVSESGTICDGGGKKKEKKKGRTKHYFKVGWSLVRLLLSQYNFYYFH